jgi:hypothetical protein
LAVSFVSSNANLGNYPNADESRRHFAVLMAEMDWFAAVGTSGSVLIAFLSPGLLLRHDGHVETKLSHEIDGFAGNFGDFTVELILRHRESS